MGGARGGAAARRRGHGGDLDRPPVVQAETGVVAASVERERVRYAAQGALAVALDSLRVEPSWSAILAGGRQASWSRSTTSLFTPNCRSVTLMMEQQGLQARTGARAFRGADTSWWCSGARLPSTACWRGLRVLLGPPSPSSSQTTGPMRMECPPSTPTVSSSSRPWRSGTGGAGRRWWPPSAGPRRRQRGWRCCLRGKGT